MVRQPVGTAGGGRGWRAVHVARCRPACCTAVGPPESPLCCACCRARPHAHAPTQRCRPCSHWPALLAHRHLPQPLKTQRWVPLRVHASMLCHAALHQLRSRLPSSRCILMACPHPPLPAGCWQRHACGEQRHSPAAQPGAAARGGNRRWPVWPQLVKRLPRRGAAAVPTDQRPAPPCTPPPLPGASTPGESCARCCCCLVELTRPPLYD